MDAAPGPGPLGPGALGPGTLPGVSRRRFLTRYAGGLGGIALLGLLEEEARAAAPEGALLEKPPHVPRGERRFDLSPRPPHFPARAKAVISLFQHGGPSHVDLLDPKEELTRRSGEDYPGDITYSFVNRASKKLLGSPFRFAPRGRSGTPLSELLPNLAHVVDEIAVVRSMYTGINGHEPSIWSMNTGLPRPGRPALGSWVTYALGSEARDLPAYVVLTDPGGLPVDGVRNWSQGWMPPLFQGTPIRPKEPRILDLEPPPAVRGPVQRQQLALLERLNRSHAERVGGDDSLEARIASYELAARMQIAASGALDLSSESARTRTLYGLDRDVTRSYGERLLLARRLVERGVRFVHVLINGQIWDNHENIKDNLAHCCARTDQPCAALVQDLRERGLLDSTLVLWGGEIGRLPVVESHGDPAKAGRDHNGQGFSIWMAGGGIRGGITHGATDEFGHKAVTDRVGPSDYHATILHLLGLDPDRVAYFHAGRAEHLTAQPEHRVVRELMA